MEFSFQWEKGKKQAKYISKQYMCKKCLSKEEKKGFRGGDNEYDYEYGQQPRPHLEDVM